MPYEVRCYDPRYEASWLACWLAAAGASHAAWHVYQAKPTYDGPAVELMALDANGEVVGLLDIELEREPGSLCLRADPGQGFVWEFSVRPHLWGKGIGTSLLREAERLLRARDVRYLEWWSMDARSQQWYENRGMECIDRHWRFAVEPDDELTAQAMRRGAASLVYTHLTCREEDWPRVQREFRVIRRPPLEPHLCKGFAHRF